MRGLITRGGDNQVCAKCSESEDIFIPNKLLISPITALFYGKGENKLLELAAVLFGCKDMRTVTSLLAGLIDMFILTQ